MVRDVRYITLNCTYRDLHDVLLTGHLKTLALVEDAGEDDGGMRGREARMVGVGVEKRGAGLGQGERLGGLGQEGVLTSVPMG